MEKSWRLTKEQYTERRKEELEKIKATGNPVQEWADWSLEPQSPEDIILRALMTSDPQNTQGHTYLCNAYVCEKSRLSPDIVDDLLFIQSGFFDYKTFNWTDDMVKDVIKLMCSDNQIADIMDIAGGVIDKPFMKARCKEIAKNTKRKIVDRLHEIKGKVASMYDSACVMNSVTKTAVFTAHYTEMWEPKLASMKELADQTQEIMKAITDVRWSRPIVDRLDWNALKKNPGISPRYYASRINLATHRAYKPAEGDR